MGKEISQYCTATSCIVAVVIPCYKVRLHIAEVLARIGPDVSQIYVIDDACPENSGNYVEALCTDSRVRVIFHETNQGVGGAVITGYRAARAAGADIIVKIDGDGQMDPALLPLFVAPLTSGLADYSKGNRFFNLDQIGQMPKMRLLGNAVLSFMSKFSTGYWSIFDPTNGYTAIHARVVDHLPLDKISKRYFFETDMLFRLNTLRAVVRDVPMDAVYAEETSNLRIRTVWFEFLIKHLRNMTKRIFYNYYLRDMSPGSLELPAGILLLGFGIIYGALHWARSVEDQLASAGTVMLAGLSVLMGVQFLLAFLSQDMASQPQQPIQRWLYHMDKKNRPSAIDAPGRDAPDDRHDRDAP